MVSLRIHLVGQHFVSSNLDTVRLVHIGGGTKMRQRELGSQTGAPGIERPGGNGCVERSQNPIHLLLTDIVMPEGMNGIELSIRLRELNQQLKVIFTSGYNPNWAQKSLKLPEGSFYIQKPCSFEQILKTIRLCLMKNNTILE